MAEGALHDRFRALCEIPSPSGSERAVADAVIAELRDAAVEVAEDGAGPVVGSDAGNLVARVPGTGDGFVCFCAHLDTVPHDGAVEVVLADGVYRSAEDTILGADDKAGVAVALEVLLRAVARPGPVGVEVLLTVSEETGLRGASALDAGTLASDVCFVLDEANPIGKVVTRSPTYMSLVAEFEGAEAHAGLRPEEGHSAIAAAALAVSRMQIGRIDEETTANVGVIHGGTASNIVAGSCRIEGEARSLDPDRVTEVVGAMSDACAWGASERGCDLDTRIEEVFRGYRIGRSRALEMAEAGLRNAGYEPERTASGAGSDANALIAQGVDALLLANGSFANHTSAEGVSARSLDAMVEVCEAILAVAAESPGEPGAAGVEGEG